MKIVCPTCQAVYTIADKKIPPGRRASATCKKCGGRIVVETRAERVDTGEFIFDAGSRQDIGREEARVGLTPQPTSVSGELLTHSYAQSPWRLVLLSILTFTIYEIYWFYRNWKHLKNNKNLDISPGWRTVGLLVPIYGIVLAYRQFSDIRDFASQSGCETYSSPGLLAFGYMLLTGISFRISMYEWNLTDSREALGLTLVSLLVDLLAIGILVVVQRTLNAFWEKEQAELKMRSKFSGREMALIVIGGIIWFLNVVATLLPE